MADLPVDHVRVHQAFQICGVDFCGPFMVRSGVRGKQPTKNYIDVFICFTTKATHLEVVHDLSTNSFILTLQRFIARRGKPYKIYSDNATNFIGTRNKLNELQGLFSSEENISKVNEECLKHTIQWLTIPARSPHFGGLWKSAVKFAKYHLSRMLVNYTPFIDEFRTVVSKIEAILNSRPITLMSNDPNDMTGLAPAHFFIGRPFNSFKTPNYCEVNTNCLDSYQRVC